MALGGEAFTTRELKINFLTRVRTGPLTATGRLLKGGRTVGLVDCDVHDNKNRPVARASSTCMTLRGEQGEGRGRGGSLRLPRAARL